MIYILYILYFYFNYNLNDLKYIQLDVLVIYYLFGLVETLKYFLLIKVIIRKKKFLSKIVSYIFCLH